METVIKATDAVGQQSQRGLARLCGILYLAVGIFGGFSEGFVDTKIYVVGNAAATAGKVLANPELVRLSVVAHLVDGTFFIFTALALFILLRHVSQNAARAMLILVAIATSIT